LFTTLPKIGTLTPVFTGVTEGLTPNNCQTRDHTPYRYVSGTVTAMQDPILHFVRIYPNPVRDLLRIDLDLPAAELELHDLKGRLLVSQELNGPTHSLDMSGYAEGLYLVKISAGPLSGWVKVLKVAR